MPSAPRLTCGQRDAGELDVYAPPANKTAKRKYDDVNDIGETESGSAGTHPGEGYPVLDATASVSPAWATAPGSLFCASRACLQNPRSRHQRGPRNNPPRPAPNVDLGPSELESTLNAFLLMRARFPPLHPEDRDAPASQAKPALNFLFANRTTSSYPPLPITPDDRLSLAHACPIW